MRSWRQKRRGSDMARLWDDGFDHYGGNTAHMLDGSYASAGVASLSTAFPATGSHGVLISGSHPGLSNENALRKVLPSAKDKMGAMGRFYFNGLPAGNIGGTIFDFLSATPRFPQVSCIVDSNGALRFLRGRNYFTLNGENGTLIAQSDPIITANAQNHIEVQIYIHDSAGWVRAAVNGLHRFEATGLDTKINSENIVSVSQSRGISGGTGAGSFYMDDYILYDFNGDSAVDTDFCPAVDGSGKATNYIGELQAMLRPPNGDTSEADFAKSTGTTGYPLIGKAAPDDTTYLYSAAAGDLSEFDLEDLPPEITYVRGVSIHQRLSKSDAGAAMMKAGMKSASATSDAAERPVTTAPTYWHDQINVDPNTSVRWTRTSFNAAKYRLQRSA